MFKTKITVVYVNRSSMFIEISTYKKTPYQLNDKAFHTFNLKVLEDIS